MAAEILLRPDNRSLDLSTNDFSIYGGQPNTTAQLAPAPIQSGTPAAGATEATEAVATSAPAVGNSNSFDPAAVSGAMPQDDALIARADGAAEAPAPASSEQAQLEPLVPSPTGSSTSPEFFAKAGLPQQSASDAAGSTAGSSGTPSATVLTEGSGTVAEALQPVTMLADATTAFLVDTVGTTAEAFGGLVTAATTAASATVEQTLDSAGQLVTGTVEATAGLTDAAGETLGNVTQPVGTVVSDVVTATTGVVSQAVEGTTDTAAAVLTDADLSQLGGSDPAAGVATLVDLVAADNLFDLRDAGAAPEGATEASPIDQLIGDVAEVSPLLGDAAHDDSGLLDPGQHHDLGI